MKRAAIVLLLFSACATSRASLVSSTLGGLTAARDTFLAWDAEHQDAIVANATDGKDARSKLADYRKVRLPVTVAFTAAFGALAIASSDGSADSLLRANAAVGSVLEALRDLGVLK